MKLFINKSAAGIAVASLLASVANALPIVVDLTVASPAARNGIINDAGFIWTDFDSSPTGTGNIDPFLRIQNTGTESGWNNDNSTMFNDEDHSWTKNLKLGSIPIVNNPFTGLAGEYYEILLDINEPRGNDQDFLSLYGLQLFTSPSAIAQTTSGMSDLAGATKHYDLGATNKVEMDASFNAGSGKGDVFMYFPTSLFAGKSANDYFYLYAQFGETQNSHSGFEEFSVREGYSTIPPDTRTNVPDGGTTVILLGLSLLGVGGVRRALAPARA